MWTVCYTANKFQTAYSSLFAFKKNMMNQNEEQQKRFEIGHEILYIFFLQYKT